MAKKQWAILMLVAIVASFMTLPLSFAETKAESKTLTVGYIDYDGYIEKAKDGTYKGYGVDYLNEVAKYTGFKYKYKYGQWNKLMSQLKAGKIDLICTASWTAERAQEYEYSKNSIGIGQEVLYTRKDNEDIYYEDFDKFGGMKVGVLKDSANIEFFQEYAKKHDFTYQQIEYDTEKQLDKALKSKEIDAIATEHIAVQEDVKLIGRFGSEPYYYISYKNNDFMDDINEAIDNILIDDPSFNAELNTKWYGDTDLMQAPNFTREEVEYIKNAKTFTVGNLQNRFPLSLADKNGNPTGINEKVIKQIAKVSGLKFNQVMIEPGKKPIDALKDGDIDLAIGVLQYAFAGNEEAVISKEYLTSKIVPVVKKNMKFNENEKITVAINKSFAAMQTYVKKEHPNWKLVIKETREDCFEAVYSGEVQATLENEYVVNYILQKPKYGGLKIVPFYSIEDKSVIVGLKENADPLLMSIINKSISSISNSKINEIVIEKTQGTPYDMTFGDFMYEYKFLFAGAMIIVLIIIGALSLLNRNRKIAAEKEHETNVYLQEAIARAEAANKGKSEFLSRMSHEIRTPMNAIVGVTAIAEKYTGDPGKMKESLSKIAVSSKMLLGIINDVLDMSAIESNKLKIESKEFDFKQTMDVVTNIYYGQCKGKEIDFSVNLKNVTEEHLVGDSLRLNQILLNILSNAYKFTPKGGKITLGIEETMKKEDKVFLRFKVTDTGEGMSEEMMQRLFSPFEQEDAGTARRHGGSGLGMSIAKNLLDMMNGVINVESQKGVGTTFTIDIPFGIADYEEDGQVINIKDMSVLVIDDAAEAREYLAMVMERIGINYDLAHDGVTGLQMIDDKKQKGICYDACFVDWKMAEMNGVEVTKKIREMVGDATTVIILSAYDLNEVEEEAKAAGANMFVAKPIFQSTVFNALMSIDDHIFTKEKSGNGGWSRKYDFGGKEVLLVEDNEMNSEIAVELLNMVDIKSEVARNGREAIEKFTQAPEGKYSAVLMDIQMPEVDGYEATKTIRHSDHPEAKTMPIIAMSADAFTEDIAKSIAAGMNDHIAKPIDTDILYGTLAKYIG